MKAELISAEEDKIESISITRGTKVMHPWFFVKKIVSLGMYDERPDDVLVDARTTEKIMGRIHLGNLILKFNKPILLGNKIRQLEIDNVRYFGVLPICRNEDDEEGVYECVYDHKEKIV